MRIIVSPIQNRSVFFPVSPPIRRRMSVCSVCQHYNKHSSGCPFCTKRRAPCDQEGCAYCTENTLASTVSADDYGSANKTAARMVWKTSQKKVWVRCETCRCTSKRSAKSIASKTRCGLCVNKTERKLFEYVRDALGVDLEYQPTFVWAKTYRYDFRVQDTDILIELDGKQHFCPVRTWKTGFDVCHDDLLKEQLANQSGFTIIRILQTDVWNDTSDWRAYLQKSLSEAPFQPPQTVCPPDKSEYSRGVYARLRSGVSFF